MMDSTRLDTLILTKLRTIAGHYYELLALLLTIVVLLSIPLKIISYGYSPPDDSKRHAAHALDDRSWDKIVVQESEMVFDTNPGWDFLLRHLHRLTQWDQEQLLTFSLISLCMLYMLTGLVLVKDPVAWVCALAMGFVMIPTLIIRITIGRPFVITICCMMVLMVLWQSRRGRLLTRCLISLVLFAAIAWFHGSWYLAILIPAAFILSGQFSSGFLLGGCWLAGSFLGACLTGHPVAFIYQQVSHCFSAFGSHLSQSQLVKEFLSTYPEAGLLLAMSTTLFVRLFLSKKSFRELTADPLFMLFLLGTILGLLVHRFGLDWGIPAAVLWMACQWRDVARESAFRQRAPLFGLTLLGVLLISIYCTTTNDVRSRWTRNLDDGYIDAADVSLQEWLPEPGGIIYSDTMSIFYRTYFHNPTAPWRYMLGYEPGLMPTEDLKIYRRMQWNGYVPASFNPWVEKMRIEDRMILLAQNRPSIAGLEWHLAAKNTWIGRKKAKPAATSPNISSLRDN